MSDTDPKVPPAAAALLRLWDATPARLCPHLNPAAPGLTVGFLAHPGALYCQDCAKANTLIDAALPSGCDLCGNAASVHGLTYRLADNSGHVIGQCCDACLNTAEVTDA